MTRLGRKKEVTVLWESGGGIANHRRRPTERHSPKRAGPGAEALVSKRALLGGDRRK